MSIENPLWGAPRIHGELLKLGFEVAQSSVAKYMVKRRVPPSQGWRTFLRNHAPDVAAMDLFVVPTFGFDLLYAFAIIRIVDVLLDSLPGVLVARRLSEARAVRCENPYQPCRFGYDGTIKAGCRTKEEPTGWGRLGGRKNSTKPFSKTRETELQQESVLILPFNNGVRSCWPRS
jgi:hypothetical protein